MKTVFQLVLVVFNIVPLLTGVAVAVNGAEFFVSPEVIDTNFDAQIRVYAIWFTAVFFLSLWMAFNIEQCGPVLRIVFTLVALAGLSRFYTMYVSGEFPPRQTVAATIEVATLLFIPWHNYVRSKLKTAAP
ncbi:MAG: DUF4345 domain-containing protein [Pseudomonadota bacterium]